MSSSPSSSSPRCSSKRRPRTPDPAVEVVEEEDRELDRSMWAEPGEVVLGEALERAAADESLRTPVLLLNVEAVRASYRELRAAMPSAEVYYAVKACPEPEVLRALAELGSSFDVASPREVDMALASGCPPARVSFGNTIKKEADIAYAYSRGVRLFAFDSDEELDKLARSAPRARVFCRVLSPDDPQAEWPLSHKFGCEPRMAERLLLRARGAGLDACGVSFHVGSQMHNTHAWRNALAVVADLYLRVPGMTLLNLGGGMPVRYTRDVPSVSQFADDILAGVREFFGGGEGAPPPPRLITEPGRSMAGGAGVIVAEVVLVSRKSDAPGEPRWVYLDVGVFGGLAETVGEAIAYRVRCGRAGDKLGPVVLAGPTCDSQDVMCGRLRECNLPLSLRAGDRVHVLATGAYTTTYSASGFNGFEPLRAVCVDGAGQ